MLGEEALVKSEQRGLVAALVRSLSLREGDCSRGCSNQTAVNDGCLQLIQPTPRADEAFPGSRCHGHPPLCLPDAAVNAT